jgi:transposase
MEELLKLLDEDLAYEKHEVYPDKIELFAYSTRTSVCCPICGESSSQVHSSHRRKIQDLPIQDKKATINLRTRNFFCSNPNCPRKTFAEPFDFTEPKAQKTKRLENLITTMSVETSSVTAAKMLSDGIVNIGKSTICNLLQKKR